MGMQKAAKTSSTSGGADKMSKPSTKRCAKQKAKWKIVGDKVHITPGDYTAEDFEAMLKALECSVERCATRKGESVG